MRKYIYFCIIAVIFSLNISIIHAETVKIMIKTSAGEIGLELYPEKAPITVKNFLKYVDNGYYEGGTFYRVVRADNQVQNKIKIGAIQGGMGKNVNDSPFTPIPHETTKKTGILHKDGVISMARDRPGSATSALFLCVQDQPDLDFGGMRNPDGQGFAAFGKVISGMDLIRKIQNMATDKPSENQLEYTSGQILSDPVIIIHVKYIAE